MKIVLYCITLNENTKSNNMKVNKGFLKKIPDNAEAALVLEGKLPGKWLVAGMHGAAFFASGRGGAGQKEIFSGRGRRKFFQGWAGQRRGKIFRRGRTTVKLGAFSGQGNLEIFLG